MATVAPFKTWLEKRGYKNVRVEWARAPQHVIEWLAGEDSGLTDDEVAETIEYYKVSTDQGNFGVGIAVYNILDLKAAGFSSVDFGEENADPNLFLVNLNDLNLLYLKKLLNEQKKNTRIH